MVDELKKDGFKVSSICRTLGIARSGYYAKRSSLKIKTFSNALQDNKLLDKIKEIGGLHPAWGYRRVTAWFKHREGYLVNKKKVYRLMKENNLLVPKKRYEAKRVSQKAKPKPIRPKEWWGIDMTKFLIPKVGWLYLVVILDWYSKKVVGFNLGLRARTKEWKKALEMAIQKECPEGARKYGINLMSDNGSQPTSEAFIKTCSLLGINQTFTSYNNPKGNADTERFILTLKEDLIWLEEWESLEEAEKAITKWFDWYNTQYIHSSLNYLSPEKFESLKEAISTKIAA